jgi:hypothetical protein
LEVRDPWNMETFAPNSCWAIVILESNLSTHVTPKMWTSAFEWANRNNKGDEQAQVIMEEPKTLQQGSSTSLIAALDPSLESRIYM